MPLPHTRHRYRVVASVAAPCQEYVIGHSGCQDFVLTFSQSSRSTNGANSCDCRRLRASPLGEPRESGRKPRPAHRRSSWPLPRSRSGTYRVLSQSPRPGFRVTGSGSLDEIEASRTAQPRIGKRMAPSVRTWPSERVRSSPRGAARPGSGAADVAGQDDRHSQLATAGSPSGRDGQ